MKINKKNLQDMTIAMESLFENTIKGLKDPNDELNVLMSFGIAQSILVSAETYKIFKEGVRAGIQVCQNSNENKDNKDWQEWIDGCKHDLYEPEQDDEKCESEEVSTFLKLLKMIREKL